jgi:hypothetical protein
MTVLDRVAARDALDLPRGDDFYTMVVGLPGASTVGG